MPASYTDFQPEPEQNTAASPKGLPAAGYDGPAVAGAIRYLMAAVRRLGDSVTASGVLGSMANQNADAVAITGGTIANVVGGSFVGMLQPFHGTVQQAETLQPYGWLIADGRTVAAFQDARGVTRGPFTMPDHRGLYPRFHGTANPPLGVSGSSTAATSEDGAHSHFFQDESLALEMQHMPFRTTTHQVQGGGGTPVVNLIGQAAEAHRHQGFTASDGAHAHTVQVFPRAISLVPLIRMF